MMLLTNVKYNQSTESTDLDSMNIDIGLCFITMTLPAWRCLFTLRISHDCIQQLCSVCGPVV